jgi:hypothetical protein
MTTQTTSTQYIGGATEQKDQPEWTDSRPITRLSSHQFMDSYLAATLCVRSVPLLRGKGGSVWLTKLPGLSILVRDCKYRSL